MCYTMDSKGDEQYVVDTQTYCDIYCDLPVLQGRLRLTVRDLLWKKEINLSHITTPFFTVRLRTAGNGCAEFFCVLKKSVRYINIE